MKVFWSAFLGLSCVLALPAHALPILNANAKGSQSEILYPDHLDKNLYYIHPSVMLVSKDASGQPNFSYMEFRDPRGKHAILQTTMVLAFQDPRMEQAKAEVLKENPAARFATVPMMNTSVQFANSLKSMVENTDCEHVAGDLSQEQSCVFQLNYRGTRVLAPMLKHGLTLTTQFRYQIDGVVQQPNGSFTNETVFFQIAGRIGGQELKSYPELFHGEDGKPLKNLSLFALFPEDQSFN